MDFMDKGGKEEELQMAKGVISSDGQKIVIENSEPEWYFKSPYSPDMQNPLNKHKIVWIFGLGFFGFLAVLYSILSYLGEVSFIFALMLFGFSSLYIFGAWFDNRGSITHPKKISFAKKGLVLKYGKTNKHTIPWDDILDLREFPLDPGSKKMAYQLVCKKNPKGVRMINLTQDCAASVNIAMIQLNEINYYFDVKNPCFKAWNIAHPESKIIITNRPLSNDEIMYRKLRRRFFDNGVYSPVYMSEDEDLRTLIKAIQSTSISLDDLKKIATMALEEGLWNEASEIWRHITTITPGEKESRTNLAGSLIKSKKYDEGMKILEDILEKEPKSSTALFLQSLAFYDQGDVDGTKYKLGFAVESDPNNIDALQLWFDIVSGESGMGQAIAEMDYLKTTHKNAWAPPYIIGFAFEKGQNFKDAYDQYQEAFKRDVNINTIGAITSILINMKKPDEVGLIFEKHQNKIPKDSPLRLGLAHAALLTGQREKAKKILNNLEKFRDHHLRISINQMKDQFNLRDE